MGKTNLSPVSITIHTIENFLVYLKKKGRNDATIRKYSADLKSFYNFLPEDKQVVRESLPNWRDFLIAKGFAERTINSRIAACNSFMVFLKRKCWQISPLSLAVPEVTPAITREEYQFLLKAAHESNQEWLYFLIKTFCCMGLSVSELHFLTVKALKAGQVSVKTKSRNKKIYIPEVLQSEFMSYVKRAKIHSGCLFKSPSGKPLTRALIVKELEGLCEFVDVPKAKATPRALRALYFSTYSDIRSAASSLIDNEYSKLLEAEDPVVVWETLSD